MEIVALILAVVAVLLVWKYFFSLFFADAKDFWECIRLSCTPDLISILKGEYFEDVWKSLKLSLYVFVAPSLGFLTYSGVHHYL